MNPVVAVLANSCQVAELTRTARLAVSAPHPCCGPCWNRAKVRLASSDADNMQAITIEGRTLLATTAGRAMPVQAAIHAVRHNGHFGSRRSAAPGKRDEESRARRRKGRPPVQHRPVITHAPAASHT